MKYAILIALALTGCANSKVINGHEYQPYGLANQDLKSDSVVYTIPAGNFICGIIFSESLVVPGYIVLFDLWEPVALKETVVK